MVATNARPTSDTVQGMVVRDPAQDARLRRIATEYYDFVWRTLRRLGILPPDTDDAAQRVFVVLAEKLAIVEPGKEFTFLFGIVMRVAFRARREFATARRRQVSEEDMQHDPPANVPSAEASLVHAEQRELLDEILAQLSDERRVVFVLFELEELTIFEIADLLSLPVGTATSRLRRARQDFQKAVARLRARKGGV